MFNNIFFEHCAVFWDNVKKSRLAGQATSDYMTRAYCMLDSPSEYIIRIAFQLRQCLHERASMLRYTYIACLVL